MKFIFRRLGFYWEPQKKYSPGGSEALWGAEFFFELLRLELMGTKKKNM